MTELRAILKNYKVLFLLACVLLSILAIAFNGVQFGIDFKGGTLFQIHLAQKPTSAQLSTITTIIQQRIDSFGLKDTVVKSFGEDFVIAQIAETDPVKVQQIESIIRTQGKFESILDGEVLFTGSDLLQIIKDPAKGYGYAQETPQGGISQNGVVNWTLPFRLNQEAAAKFSRGIFHKCETTSFTTGQGSQYDCKATYFFIDRPTNAVLVLPKKVFENDTELLRVGNQAEDINPNTDIDELMQNSQIQYFLVDENGFSETQKSSLAQLVLSKEEAIVHPQVLEELKIELKQSGFKVTEIGQKSNEIPWVWTATGAKQTISLTPGITGFDPYISDVSDAKIFSDLVITGTAEDFKTAQVRLGSLTILLETGSLPIPIDDVSNETISPFLGKEFLDATILMGILALIVVAAIIFIRYHNIKIAVPIIITGASEVLLLVGFASILRINLDLATVAGILAVIGTGVDHQIIIIDELLRGEATTVSESLVSRVKKAFFIIFAAATVSIATMLPIIFFGLGLGKLLGFAVITIAGVLIAVGISRPAFAEIAKWAIKR